MNLRRWLHRSARVYGDVKAVSRGRIIERLYNRVVGRLIGRVARRLWM